MSQTQLRSLHETLAQFEGNQGIQMLRDKLAKAHTLVNEGTEKLQARLKQADAARDQLRKEVGNLKVLEEEYNKLRKDVIDDHAKQLHVVESEIKREASDARSKASTAELRLEAAQKENEELRQVAAKQMRTLETLREEARTRDEISPITLPKSVPSGSPPDDK